MRAPKGGKPQKCPTPQFSTPHFFETPSSDFSQKLMGGEGISEVCKFVRWSRSDDRKWRQGLHSFWGFSGLGAKPHPPAGNLTPIICWLHRALLIVTKILTHGNRKLEIFGGSSPNLVAPGPAPNSGGGSVIAPFGRSERGARSCKILGKSDERFSRKSQFYFFPLRSRWWRTSKENGLVMILF